MRVRSADRLMALALFAALGCAGSSARTDTAGAGPIDTVRIRQGDTLPPANPPPGQAAGQPATQPPDTARPTVPGAAQQDSTSGMSTQPGIDTARADSIRRSDSTSAR
jgi:hypothetical protein